MPAARFPLLDSLRALAALSILVVHVAIYSGTADGSGIETLLRHLDIGVPFFFLLSAFLLYRPFVADRAAGRPRRSLRAYGIRRFVRIFPAYWLALTVAAVIPGFYGAFSGDAWAYYALLQPFPVIDPGSECGVGGAGCGIPVAWSLTVEVGFYALLPLIVLLMARLTRGRTDPRPYPELGLLAVLGGASVLIQSMEPGTNAFDWLFYSPLGRGWWFGLGLLLAAVSVWAEGRSREPRFVPWLRAHPVPPIALAAALYVLLCLTLDEALLSYPLGDEAQFVVQNLLAGVIAALVLLPAVFGTDGGGAPRRLLAHRTSRWLGAVSYGIFLWQFPVMIALIEAGLPDLSPAPLFAYLLVSTFALTLACAALSFYALERPLMRRVRSGRSFDPAGIAGADDVPGGLGPVEPAVGSQHQRLG